MLRRFAVSNGLVGRVLNGLDESCDASFKNLVRGISPGSSRMKNINWKNIGTIFVVAVVAIIAWPKIRPMLAKLPVVGSWV